MQLNELIRLINDMNTLFKKEINEAIDINTIYKRYYYTKWIKYISLFIFFTIIIFMLNSYNFNYTYMLLGLNTVIFVVIGIYFFLNYNTNEYKNKAEYQIIKKYYKKDFLKKINEHEGILLLNIYSMYKNCEYDEVTKKMFELELSKLENENNFDKKIKIFKTNKMKILLDGINHE